MAQDLLGPPGSKFLKDDYEVCDLNDLPLSNRGFFNLDSADLVKVDIAKGASFQSQGNDLFRLYSASAPTQCSRRFDATPSYTAISPYEKAYHGQQSTPEEPSNALPWVHTAISNAKRLFLGFFIICFLFGLNLSSMNFASNSMGETFREALSMSAQNSLKMRSFPERIIRITCKYDFKCILIL